MSQINKVLDDYYAPIKLPDNNRDGLKADLRKAIMDVMPKKRGNIDEDGHGWEDMSYNQAIKEVLDAIDALFNK